MTYTGCIVYIPVAICMVNTSYIHSYDQTLLFGYALCLCTYDTPVDDTRAHGVSTVSTLIVACWNSYRYIHSLCGTLVSLFGPYSSSCSIRHVAMATEADIQQEQLQRQQQQQPPHVQYQEIAQECAQLMQKIAELEVDRNEHVLVEETLIPLDGGRRAYRLVGDVLVERTVKEVLPSVTSNKENVRNDEMWHVPEFVSNHI